MEAQWRTLAAHVLIRAAVDATGTNEKEQEEALNWLNSADGRATLAVFGLIVQGTISPQDLRVVRRNVYYNGSVSQETEREQRNVRVNTS